MVLGTPATGEDGAEEDTDLHHVLDLVPPIRGFDEGSDLLDVVLERLGEAAIEVTLVEVVGDLEVLRDVGAGCRVRLVEDTVRLCVKTCEGVKKLTEDTIMVVLPRHQNLGDGEVVVEEGSVIPPLDHVQGVRLQLQDAVEEPGADIDRSGEEKVHRDVHDHLKEVVDVLTVAVELKFTNECVQTGGPKNLQQLIERGWRRRKSHR